MQRAFERLRLKLSWFATEQREHLALVLRCGDFETMWIHTVFEGLKQSDPTNLYLTFTHEAKTARAYIDVLVELVEMHRRALDAQALAAGEPRWSELPASARDARRTPAERLRSVVGWLRDRHPDPARRIVLVLVPSEMPDPEAYRGVVRDLLPWRGLEAWSRGVRLVLREPAAQPSLLPEVQAAAVDGVLASVVDFGPDAIAAGLQEDAQDRDLPPEVRANAILQTAAMDFAQRRHPQALEKFGHLFNVYQRLGNVAMKAMCLCMAGDVHRTVGQLDLARKRYEQGLVAVREKDPPNPAVLHQLLCGWSEVMAAQGEHSEAEGGWDLAARVAGHMRNAGAVADAMENVGVARLAQRNVTGAVGVWEGALPLCEEDENHERAVSILERLVEVAKRNLSQDRADAYRRQLAAEQARVHSAA